MFPHWKDEITHAVARSAAPILLEDEPLTKGSISTERLRGNADMRENNVKISHLEEFATLATTLSYSQTAKRRYLSTSALSKHIASLERYVGETLFARDTHSVALTTAGKAFYEGIQPILDDYERFLADFKKTCWTEGDHLLVRLSIRPPYLVRAFADLGAPDRLPFRVSYASSFENQHAHFLEETSEGLVILYDSGRIDRERFDVARLAEVPLVALLPITHPLAQKDVLSFDRDLNQQTLVKLHSRFFSPGWDAIETLLARHGVEARSTSSFASSSFDLAILNGFDDILLVPESPTAPFTLPAGGRHKLLRFKERRCFDVVGVWSKTMADSASARTYVSLLKETIARLTPQFACQEAQPPTPNRD